MVADHLQWALLGNPAFVQGHFAFEGLTVSGELGLSSNSDSVIYDTGLGAGDTERNLAPISICRPDTGGHSEALPTDNPPHMLGRYESIAHGSSLDPQAMNPAQRCLA
ncbi:hypothetical protein CC2G_002697 [Coprinopsis cinerea AmutBmut pab1-1]|nr:hypothetical protein CC2G_002697 [Coprinopsis cinerea AmutBmut pab1-1]